MQEYKCYVIRENDFKLAVDLSFCMIFNLNDNYKTFIFVSFARQNTREQVVGRV